MKILKYSILLLGIASVLVFTSCKKKPPVITELDQRIIDLKNNGSAWIIGTSGSVMKDDYDVTDQFKDFKLTFGDKTYTTVNGVSPVWPVSGTWDFKGGNKDIIIRADGVEMSVNLNGNTLMLSFIAEGITSGGRIGSVKGAYNFLLEKE